jgi:hypothetical protein
VDDPALIVMDGEAVGNLECWSGLPEKDGREQASLSGR